jgi:cell division protein FtsB
VEEIETKKMLIIGIVIGLLIGLAAGYGAAPKGVDTTELEQKISDLEAQVANLQNQVANKDTQIADLQAQIEELEALVPPLKKGEWNTITTFTGSTGKTTELFYIPSGTWRINWTYTNGALAVFGFFVYPEGETVLFVESLSTMGPSQSDTTYIYEGPGNYYIKLTVANIVEWTLTIEAFIPS